MHVVDMQWIFNAVRELRWKIRVNFHYFFSSLNFSCSLFFISLYACQNVSLSLLLFFYPSRLLCKLFINFPSRLAVDKIDNGKCKKLACQCVGNKFEMIFLTQYTSFVSSNSLISHRHCCSIFNALDSTSFRSLISSNALCNFRQLLNNNE